MTTQHPGRRFAVVHLYLAEDVEKIQELAADVADAMNAATGGDGPALASDAAKVVEASDRYNEYVEEAKGRTIPVRVTALPRRRFRDLKKNHPPRTVPTEGDDQGGAQLHPDDDRGVNEDTFPDALVPASITEPTFEFDSARDAWLDDLSEGDFDRIYQAAFVLNARSADPKALPSFGPTGESDET